MGFPVSPTATSDVISSWDGTQIYQMDFCQHQLTENCFSYLLPKPIFMFLVDLPHQVQCLTFMREAPTQVGGHRPAGMGHKDL